MKKSSNWYRVPDEFVANYVYIHYSQLYELRFVDVFEQYSSSLAEQKSAGKKTAAVLSSIVHYLIRQNHTLFEHRAALAANGLTHLLSASGMPLTRRPTLHRFCSGILFRTIS